jgi:hypothetical protein
MSLAKTAGAGPLRLETDTSGEAQVTLVRRVPLVSYPGQWDEKIHFYFGRTPESALAEAKADVEKAILKAQAGASR